MPHRYTLFRGANEAIWPVYAVGLSGPRDAETTRWIGGGRVANRTGTLTLPEARSPERSDATPAPSRTASSGAPARLARRTIPEATALWQLAQAHDRSAVDSLLQYVRPVALKYVRSGIELADLEGEGALALTRCLDKFDPAKNTNFIDYLLSAIHRACTRFVENERKHQNGVAVHDEGQVALGATEEADTHRGTDSSFNDAVAQISDPRSADEPVIAADLADALDGALATLKERDALVLAMSFGVSGYAPHTFDQIGHFLKISRQRVKIIHKAALTRLRSMESLRDFLSDISRAAA